MESSNTTTEDTLSKMSSYDDAAGESQQQHPLAVLGASLKKQESSGILLTDEQLRAQDICCGRGRGYWKHPGNKTFDHLIQANAHLYSKWKDENNRRLVTSIVQEIRNNGARFVKQDKQNAGRWIELDETSSRVKTRHAIRDYFLCKSKQKTKEETANKKEEEFKKKMKMGVTISREMHQKSPNPSAAVDGSYPRTPSALSHSYQEARMRAPALDEPCYPLCTDISGSSIHPIPQKLKEAQGRYHTNAGLEESLEIFLSRYFDEDEHTLSREGSYPRTPNALLMQFHQEARMRAPPAFDKPSCYPRRQGMEFDTFYYPSFV
jgi:hypothetical protein